MLCVVAFNSVHLAKHHPRTVTRINLLKTPVAEPVVIFQHINLTNENSVNSVTKFGCTEMCNNYIYKHLARLLLLLHFSIGYNIGVLGA